MSQDTCDRLNDLYREFVQSADKTDAFNAAVRLGEIWNCAQTMPNRVGEQWKQKVDDAWTLIRSPESIGPELADRLRRIQRMVGFGAKFQYEELVAIISDRVEIDLVLELLPEISDLDWSAIERLDQSIKSLAASPENRQPFRSAQNAVSKNWGSPIRHWLFD